MKITLKNMSVLKDIGKYYSDGKDNYRSQWGITSYEIPSNIIKLDNYCFSGCSRLISITIPDSVSHLGKNCFAHCTSLYSITLPKSVTYLGDDCFNRCPLNSITIPESVSYLSRGCFYGCSNLKSITIPNSVSYIGDCCFECCYYLSSITIPDSVSYLGGGCFKSCTNLSSITLPESVTYLGEYCFWNCSRLSSIVVPENKLLLLSCNKDIINKKINIITYKPKKELEIENKKNNEINSLKKEIEKLKQEKDNEIKKLKQEKDNEIKKLKEELEKIKQVEIEPIKIELPQISDDYNPDLLNYNEYIKERSELIENYQNNSVVKYHESIVDIAEDFNENIKVKQLELQEYSRIIQTYSNDLSEISSNLTKKINQHTQKLKEIEENNYELPELNTIPQLDQIVTPKFISNSYEIEINLNDNYYHKDDLIIPKTNNPYTEVYKLPCNFTEINSSNMRLLANREKKIALLPIEYNYEYIDLSNTNIQYFIDTFKDCPNLKEIKYPDSVEYK